MTSPAVDFGCNLSIEIRDHLVDDDRLHIVLSSGYSIFGFDEPVQRELIELLDRLNIGWVQYAYPERRGDDPLDDLLISSGMAALRLVVRQLKAAGKRRIALFGISFGANISLECALTEEVAALLLINTVFDYVDFRRRQLGGEDAIKRWRDRGLVEIPYGDRVLHSSYRFVREARRQHLLERAAGVRAPILACQGDQDGFISPDGVTALARSAPDCTSQVIPGADHAFTDPASIGQFLTLAETFLGRIVDGPCH